MCEVAETRRASPALAGSQRWTRPWPIRLRCSQAQREHTDVESVSVLVIGHSVGEEEPYDGLFSHRETMDRPIEHEVSNYDTPSFRHIRGPNP
jgi:hypothetical protein